MGVGQQYAAMREKVEARCRAVGRDPREVTLVAVSKTVGTDRVEEAVIAGAKHFDLPETYVTGLNRFLTKLTLDLKNLNQDANAPLPPGPVKGVRPRALAPK